MLTTALTPLQTLRFLSCSSLSASPPKSARSAYAMTAPAVRIAVVGDVHDYWDLQEDTKALQFLQPDLVLFTGDFGNENVKLVQSVAGLEFPKAVILGNHDSWKTQEFSGKRKDGVQLQLECLGEEHVAYQRLDFPILKLSIVGGRPFSCGGQQIFRKRLLSARYGVQDMDGSAKRIYKAAMDTPEDHLAILLAHNGPTGLGSELNDICGKDWVIGAGDHGDPDLAQAISLLKDTTKVCIPLVVFGHMHKELAYGNGLRKMNVVGADNTIYLNGAIVPRVKRLTDEQGTENRSFVNSGTSLSTPESRGTMRAFTVVEILEGRVDKIAESWVSVVGDTTTLQEEHILFKHGN
ncbi:Calcineurin-like metallo-phosphoesterase superfamily protein [Melia azedarach]|uniref:Calcineurin-like metallo-phosphoesterase superfamily protein n=1 Tax=Melia azedarach TaxID=155640 RepID=A0ACC1XE22_MELAZ|nr:Calcineurin-like metallo-phosphoesterase superfamily protein [Melia azedarach]